MIQPISTMTLMQTLCEEQQEIMLDIIDEFDHGRCHDLTYALNKTLDLPCYAIKGKSSVMLIHSFVMCDHLTLDAYGLNSMDHTRSRYQAICQITLGEDARIEPISVNELDAWTSVVSDDSEDDAQNIHLILKDVRPLLERICITA